MSEPSSPGRPFRVLAVCLGNLCRSPAAELLLARGLTPYGISVGSAGVIAPDGLSVHEWTAAPLTALGVNSSAHRSLRLAPEHLEQADLVLALTREIRADTVRLVPSSVARAWTLREFVRYAGAAHETLRAQGLLPPPGGERLRALRDEARALRGTLPRVGPEEDDIGDPIEGDAQAHSRAVGEVSTATDELIRLVVV